VWTVNTKRLAKQFAADIAADLDHLDACIRQYRVERGLELSGAIADEKPEPRDVFAEVHDGRDMFCPGKLQLAVGVVHQCPQVTVTAGRTDLSAARERDRAPSAARPGESPGGGGRPPWKR
jgi:hypothetical protein